MRRTGATIALVLLGLACGSPSAAAKYQLSVQPPVGGTHTVFYATFVSPITPPGPPDRGDYVSELNGPGRCRHILQDGPMQLVIRKGTRVTFRYSPRSVIIL